MATPKRPLSPFMIGPYYRPQLTSMLSITHRATGVFLALGAFAMTVGLVALATGADSYARFVDFLAGPFGMVLVAALVFSLAFHFFNGIRHLLWDVGWGLEIPRTYMTGYVVIVLAVVATILILLRAFGGSP